MSVSTELKLGKHTAIIIIVVIIISSSPRHRYHPLIITIAECDSAKVRCGIKAAVVWITPSGWPGSLETARACVCLCVFVCVRARVYVFV